MTKIINYAIATLSIVAFSGSLAPAIADDLNSSNTTTGSNSNNEVNTLVENSTTINNSNNADINNNLSVTANTGNNSASDNTGDASISTGNINGDVAVNNGANLNETGLGSSNLSSSTSVDINGTNTNTGSHSNNEVNGTIQTNLDINSSNNAYVNNNISGDFNTGGNKANDNTGDATINTGDININAKVDNCLNINLVNGFDKNLDCPIGGVELPPAVIPSGEVIPPTTAGSVPNVISQPGAVLAAAAANPLPQPAPVAPGNILSAQMLPVTGSAVNFKILLLMASLMSLVGLAIREKSKQKLAMVFAKSSRRIYTRNAI